MGLSSEDVASAMASIFSGSTISTLRDDNRLVDIVVKGLPEARRDPETLANLQLTLPNGQTVPLRQIAELSYGLEEPIIWRRQREPFISVQLDTEPGMLPQTLSAALAPQVQAFAARLPSGYRLEESGAVAESEKGNASIFNVLPVTLLVMLLLLMIQLKRFSRMLIAFLTAPFGMIGVVLAMLPTGTPMGFVAILGVIALSGMIIRNAVILISEVDTNRSQGKSVDESIVEATRHRSRPIVLTACAAILGMIPIAGQVFWGPMAYAIIGGLLVATAFTLIVLPAALAILMRWENRNPVAQH
jgi:multidrug efflux pump subunit AcrB